MNYCRDCIYMEHSPGNEWTAPWWLCRHPRHKKAETVAAHHDPILGFVHEKTSFSFEVVDCRTKNVNCDCPDYKGKT